jgi:hypothetical protein
MKKFYQTRTVLIFLLLLAGVICQAQSLTTGQEIQYNPITTAVPFLNITPDSRHGAMGDVGVATSPDASSQHWNPSKYAFTKDKFGFAISYTPWLRQLVSDINLAYLSGYFKLDAYQALGASLRYLSIGDILLTDENGSNLAHVKPNEFAFDVSYSRKLSDYFSSSVALRYIRSDISGGIGLESYVPGSAFSSDVSFFFTRSFGDEEKSRTISAGINLSNIGSTISYDEGRNKEYLPANLRLGATYMTELNSNNSFAFSLDFNKLMVPTPKTHLTSTNGTGSLVIAGSDANTTVISSIFNSFSDAPGGLKEELKEINYSAGIEYWYRQIFAIRGGYFNEDQYKGNRKFFSTGLGLKMNVCSVDVSYLIPVHQNNPLANTIRFTLLFDLGRVISTSGNEIPAETTIGTTQENK